MLDEMDELVKQQEILLNTHCELPCDSHKELAEENTTKRNKIQNDKYNNVQCCLM